MGNEILNELQLIRTLLIIELGSYAQGGPRSKALKKLSKELRDLVRDGASTSDILEAIKANKFDIS